MISTTSLMGDLGDLLGDFTQITLPGMGEKMGDFEGLSLERPLNHPFFTHRQAEPTVRITLIAPGG